MNNIIIKAPVVNIHHPADTRLDQVLANQVELKQLLQAQGETLMANGEKLTELKGFVQELNQNTNDIAAQGTRINAKLDEILTKLAEKEGGLTAAEVDELKTELQAARDASQVVEDNLKKVGADPAEPLPPIDPIVLPEDDGTAEGGQ